MSPNTPTTVLTYLMLFLAAWISFVLPDSLLGDSNVRASAGMPQQLEANGVDNTVIDPTQGQHSGAQDIASPHNEISR